MGLSDKKEKAKESWWNRVLTWLNNGSKEIMHFRSAFAPCGRRAEDVRGKKGGHTLLLWDTCGPNLGSGSWVLPGLCGNNPEWMSIGVSSRTQPRAGGKCVETERLGNLLKVTPLIPSISFQRPCCQLLLGSAKCSGRRDEICHCQSEGQSGIQVKTFAHSSDHDLCR